MQTMQTCYFIKRACIQFESFLAQFSLKRFWTESQTRGGVEDTRLEAKAKDTKKFRGQGQVRPSGGQGQGPRTQTQVFFKKKGLYKFFSGDLKKKGLQNFFSGEKGF